MTYSIGEVAKIFNLSTETIKYYEKEGLLSPNKNEVNNYRIYSDYDIIKLYDILFYRSVDMPINGIRKILNGEKMEKVTELISKTEAKIMEQKKYYDELLSRLQRWKKLHNEDSVKYIDQYEIREMPLAYRSSIDYTKYTDYTVHYMKAIGIKDEVNYNSTLAFSCTFMDNRCCDFKKYIILEEDDMPNLSGNEKFTFEYSDNCLYTVAEFNPKLDKMFAPLFEYASQNSIELSGKIYGRLCYVNHEQVPSREYYRLYAEIHTKNQP